MQVRVRLFAVLRERAGADELELELPDGARSRDALARMSALTAAAGGDGGQPRVRRRRGRCVAGDELALIPPVSGGAHRRSSTCG